MPPPANRAPAFSQSSYSFTLSASATSIGSLVATDPDGNSLSYRILSASTRNASNTDIFAIDGTSGVMSIASGKSLAFSDSPYTLTVQVADNGSPALNARTSVQVIAGLSFEAQSFTVSENKGNRVGDTAIGTVQATTVQGRTLSYYLPNHSNLFTINPSTGVLSLADNQCFDYSTNPTHTILVAAYDGTTTKTNEVTVQVQEAESNTNLCGDISSMAPVIDGSASSFFYGGTGTKDNPYIIPISRCCADFTLTYDPNYTSSSPDIYFRANLIDGTYSMTFTNTETFEAGEPPDYGIIFIVRDEYTIVPPETPPTAIPFSATAGYSVVRSKDGNSNIATHGALTIQARTSLAERDGNKKWLSKKSFRFQRQ